MISRRKLISFSFIAPLFYHIATLKYFAMADDKNNDNRYQLTPSILQRAYWVETIAYKHYERYTQKALKENYPNIAYLFSALSSSEKIHADNYMKVIVSLASSIIQKEISISIGDTKSNLKEAAIKEIEKIEKFYPEILKQLSSESHDKAIISCVYSWKSHKQHEKFIKQIEKNSGIFFKPLAKKIESMKVNYYVCGICGSTVDKKPAISCPICNFPVSHYKKIEMPILSLN